MNGDRVLSRERPGFDEWFAQCEPRLRQALVAVYGPVDGREATVEALSWAWEHWHRVHVFDNPVGYLFRVGQSSVRRFAATSPGVSTVGWIHDPQLCEPALATSLAELPDQQRLIVLLVHGFEWRQSEVAEVLRVTPSTVNAHLRRGLARLRKDLHVEHL